MTSKTIDEEMNQIVTCKYCKGKSLYGEMMWLNGKEMCPKCYNMFSEICKAISYANMDIT